MSAAHPQSAGRDDPGDTGYGWVMFISFLSAVLAISFAVGVLAMNPSWWVLGVVYGTDLVVTGLVFKVVLGAFVSPSYTDLSQSERTAPEAEPPEAVVHVRTPAPQPAVVLHQ